MFEITCICSGRLNLLCTFVNWLCMLTISCSWEDERRLHRRQPNLDYCDEAMVTIDKEEIPADGVVRVAERELCRCSFTRNTVEREAKKPSRQILRNHTRGLVAHKAKDRVLARLPGLWPHNGKMLFHGECEKTGCHPRSKLDSLLTSQIKGSQTCPTGKITDR